MLHHISVLFYLFILCDATAVCDAHRLHREDKHKFTIRQGEEKRSALFSLCVAGLWEAIACQCGYLYACYMSHGREITLAMALMSLWTSLQDPLSLP